MKKCQRKQHVEEVIGEEKFGCTSKPIYEHKILVQYIL